MSRKSSEIKCVFYVPDGNGGYRDYATLQPKEREAFSQQCASRMGSRLSEYFTAHPEVYAGI